MKRFNFGSRWFFCVAVLLVVSTKPVLGQVVSDVALDSPKIGYAAPVCAFTLLGAIGGAMIAPTEMQGAWATAGGTFAALVQVGLVYGTNRLISWQTRGLEAALAQISFHLRLLPFPEADLWNDRHQYDRRVEKLIQWIETVKVQTAWNDFLKTPNEYH